MDFVHIHSDKEATRVRLLQSRREYGMFLTSPYCARGFDLKLAKDANSLILAF